MRPSKAPWLPGRDHPGGWSRCGPDKSWRSGILKPRFFPDQYVQARDGWRLSCRSATWRTFLRCSKSFRLMVDKYMRICSLKPIHRSWVRQGLAFWQLDFPPHRVESSVSSTAVMISAMLICAVSLLSW